MGVGSRGSRADAFGKSGQRDARITRELFSATAPVWRHHRSGRREFGERGCRSGAPAKLTRSAELHRMPRLAGLHPNWNLSCRGSNASGAIPGLRTGARPQQTAFQSWQTGCRRASPLLRELPSGETCCRRYAARECSLPAAAADEEPLFSIGAACLHYLSSGSSRRKTE